jgi:hypothetical protein
VHSAVRSAPNRPRSTQPNLPKAMPTARGLHFSSAPCQGPTAQHCSPTGLLLFSLTPPTVSPPPTCATTHPPYPMRKRDEKAKATFLRPSSSCHALLRAPALLAPTAGAKPCRRAALRLRSHQISHLESAASPSLSGALNGAANTVLR